MSDLRTIDALLLDMDGVLYVGDAAIPGAAEALRHLREQRIPFRFITNTTTRTPEALREKMQRLGIAASPEEIFTALSATRLYLEERGKPSLFLLVREQVKSMFRGFPQDDRNPDYVVIGDIGADWDYATLNRVFNMIMAGAGLICMHRNKFWQTEDGLRMDIGAFVAGLEYVTDTEALVIGKPSSTFFRVALASLASDVARTAIVGDDIDADIGGGQAVGLQGVLVRSGKFREATLQHSPVRPDHVLDSIAGLPALLARVG